MQVKFLLKTLSSMSSAECSTTLYAQFDYIPASTAGANGEGWYLAQDGDYAYNMNDWVLESGAGFVIDCTDRNMKVIIPSAL